MYEKIVVLVSGKKRSGKDYLVNKLMEHYNGLSFKIALADSIKRILAKTLDLSIEEVEVAKINNEIISYLGKEISFREALQYIGTEAIQTEFGKKVWCKKANKTIKKQDNDLIFISDCRFDHEYDYFSERYFTILLKVVGEHTNEVDNHISENGLFVTPHYIFENSFDEEKFNENFKNLIKYFDAKIHLC